jgi:hypothetical protein
MVVIWLLRLQGGQGEGHPCTLAYQAFQDQLATVGLDECPGYCQTQPTASVSA